MIRSATRLSLWLAALLFSQAAFSQTNRIKYNNQELFLSGANLAWLSFANDLGRGFTDSTTFGDILLQMHDHGGNALRWWLHTNGTVTPAFDNAGFAIGPGATTIHDLKKALDIAWEREIGVDLCLWSFDMLRSSNPAPDPVVLNRNLLMLTDTNYTRAYINNCLIPMVDSLKHHPAIIAWEIFNEPEGMSNEFGWSEIQRVPMSAIQRFINLCAGAIHRTDPTAQVTNGSWSFLALSDAAPLASLAKAGSQLSQLSTSEKERITAWFNRKYRLSLSSDEVTSYLQRIAGVAGYNYYSDSRLIAAGGDPDGTLDFYSVHYYSGIRPSDPTAISPFHHPASYWQLDKPIVVAEFAMQGQSAPPYIPKENLFQQLYQYGYAGALAWSWTDVAFSSHADMLAAMQYMWDNYRDTVDVHGIGGDWPVVTITSPKSDSVFASGAQVTIVAKASDDDGSVVLVEFFANDTLKIRERTTAPDSVYSITWTNAPAGNYTLTAVATDNQGHRRTSNRVQIKVGTPAVTRLEAEATARSGLVSKLFVTSDPTASGGAYLDMQTYDQEGDTRITWTIPSLAAGSYPIAFGYKLAYASPKTQFINVNGTRVTALQFDGALNVWLEKGLTVNLVQGSNSIQMQLSWGWMYLDYLAVPTSVLTSVEGSFAELPSSFSLQQNYPNPFNPSTAISFQLPASSFVTLKIFDVLGREVAALVNEVRPAGRYTVSWDARQSAGGLASDLPSGVYFYRLEAKNSTQSFVETKKMILLK
jgi:hypothetical protein